jgi:hypothetical protein
MAADSSLVNRGNNLVTVAFLATLGLGILVEAFREVEWIDKVDDILMVLLALWALVWYFQQDHRHARSYTPFFLVLAVLAVKIVALIIEFGDADAVGDEFGVLLPLIAMTILTWVLVRKAKRTGEAA